VDIIVSTGPSGGGSLIQISLLKPTPGAFVPDQAAIEAQVASTYEIGSVIADMAGRETVLAVDPGTCAGGGGMFLRRHPVAGRLGDRPISANNPRGRHGRQH
jgi:hypothetical protein